MCSIDQIKGVVNVIRESASARWLRKVASWSVVLVFLAGTLVAVQIIPEWQISRANVRPTEVGSKEGATRVQVVALEDDMRRTLLQVLGGVGAIIALYFTFRRVRVAEQGHITDRFTQAIQQLGALTENGLPNIEVRLGAIYALERIAIDSERDHWAIMEVLTAYLRQNAQRPSTPPTESENNERILSEPRTDIRAILNVLGRRKRGRKRERKEDRLNLTRCDLRGANLYQAHLEHAFFLDALIDGAKFVDAHLEFAEFRHCDSNQVIFRKAHLREARFVNAQLKKANFNHADLRNVIFKGSDLLGAHFTGADVFNTDFRESKHFLLPANSDAKNVKYARWLL